MIARHKKILREIIANYFGVSQEELCQSASVTEKTLRSDIQAIEDTLHKYHLFLCFDENRIFIPFEQKEQFIDVYEEIMKEDEGQILSSEKEERKMNLLLYLAKSNNPISMNALADRFYISKASISNIVHELKQEIPFYEKNAQIAVSKQGVQLLASEKEVREILVRVFTKDEGSIIKNIYFLNYLSPSFRQQLPLVVEQVDAFLHNENIVMSNVNVSNLIAHTLIVAQRYQHHCYLDEQDIEEDPLYDRYKQSMDCFKWDVPSKEFSCLPLKQLNRSIIQNPLSEEIVETFIEQTNRKFQSKILDINDAYQLIAHVDECIEKGFHRTKMYEFVQEQMLQRLLSAYILCGDLCRLIEEKTGKRPDEENRAYMAMYIQGMYRKNIVIQENMLLFDRNISECEMIKTDLEKHFGPKAIVKPVYLLWDIEKELDAKSYAIVLSTKSVLADFNHVPFIKIHPFLTNDDYEKIDKIVYKNKPVSIHQATCNTQQMQFENVSYPLLNEILWIRQVYLTTIMDNRLPTGVYEMKYKDDRKLFVFNYNHEDAFLIYHRFINRFGQMLKEGKIS